MGIVRGGGGDSQFSHEQRASHVGVPWFQGHVCRFMARPWPMLCRIIAYAATDAYAGVAAGTTPMTVHPGVVHSAWAAGLAADAGAPDNT